jgi:hypothetical protein
LSKNEAGEIVYADREIKGVDVTGEIAKLQLDTTEIEIDKIDVVTEALKCVGKQVTTADGTYDITGVTIDDRIPYLIAEDGTKVKFSSIIR